MKYLFVFILCIVINFMTRYLFEKGKELFKIIKLKNNFKDLQEFNIEDFNINKDFWEDIEKEDIKEDIDYEED